MTKRWSEPQRGDIFYFYSVYHEIISVMLKEHIQTNIKTQGVTQLIHTIQINIFHYNQSQISLAVLNILA
jgi:hypothetical protein